MYFTKAISSYGLSLQAILTCHPPSRQYPHLPGLITCIRCLAIGRKRNCSWWTLSLDQVWWNESVDGQTQIPSPTHFRGAGRQKYYCENIYSARYTSPAVLSHVATCGWQCECSSIANILSYFYSSCHCVSMSSAHCQRDPKLFELLLWQPE